MISILLLLVSMAYSTENEQDLHARLLGTSDAQVEMLGARSSQLMGQLWRLPLAS
jgi:hypothetical protein